LTNPGRSKIIVFLPTTKMTQLFATVLRELSKTSLPSGRNTKVYEIHSKKQQDARTTTSDAFRNDKSGASILVTSDVSARGVDYPGVTRVIQIGIPAGTEQYIHRVGRTGRAGTQGRGDLVLLPWEIGFVTWQLTEVPLKPLTLNELTSQVKALASQYDADPKSFFENVPGVSEGAVRYDKRGREIFSGPRMFTAPVSAVIENINNNITGLLNNIDELAVKETFASLLGYYMAKSPELRTQKGVIVQGCKDWTTQACGLETPPYVSESFLHKLGLSDGRTKNFGRAFARDGRRTASGSSWTGRGQQRLKGRETSRPAWASSYESEEGDPERPEEYRSHRYGRAPQNESDEEPSGRFRRDSSSYGRSGGYARREGGFGVEQRDTGRGGYGESGGFGRRQGGYGRDGQGKSGFGMR
jgi:ATP-dependent RNA helicase MSS116